MASSPSDFRGICWERDTCNIRTCSADIGIDCYEYRNGIWEKNESLKPPEYIVPPYDEEYKNSPELWSTIYHSPTEKQE